MFMLLQVATQPSGHLDTAMPIDRYTTNILYLHPYSMSEFKMYVFMYILHATRYTYAGTYIHMQLHSIIGQSGLQSSDWKQRITMESLKVDKWVSSANDIAPPCMNIHIYVMMTHVSSGMVGRIVYCIPYFHNGQTGVYVSA